MPARTTFVNVAIPFTVDAVSVPSSEPPFPAEIATVTTRPESLVTTFPN